MFSIKKIYLKVIDLIFKRVIFLLLVGIVLFFMLINQGTLKLKTINTVTPNFDQIKRFMTQPRQMSRDEMKNMLDFYKSMCDLLNANSSERPAPCGFAGYAYYYLGDDQKAQEYYEKTLKLSPYFLWFNYNLGAIYYNNENYDKAMTYFVRARDAEPSSIYFLSRTETYIKVAVALNSKSEDLEHSLVEGYHLANKMLVYSKLFSENPQIRRSVMKEKLDLRLF
jgi:tetratricopeptide (TPR) repeat protein